MSLEDDVRELAGRVSRIEQAMGMAMEKQWAVRRGQ